MSLRFFIDQCVPRSVSESLSDVGHTVELLRSHLPINAKDPDVINCAQSLDAVLVTLNGDLFLTGREFYVSGEASGGIEYCHAPMAVLRSSQASTMLSCPMAPACNSSRAF